MRCHSVEIKATMYLPSQLFTFTFFIKFNEGFRIVHINFSDEYFKFRVTANSVWM